MLDTLDRLLPIILGLFTIGLGLYLLWRLWGETGRHGLILMVVLMVGGGSSFVWWGMEQILHKS